MRRVRTLTGTTQTGRIKFTWARSESMKWLHETGTRLQISLNVYMKHAGSSYLSFVVCFIVPFIDKCSTWLSPSFMYSRWYNKPKEDSQNYFSYKMKYTLNIQGVRGSMGRFIDVDINWPGGTHDAKLFANSRINKAMREGKIPKMFRVLLPRRDEVPLLLFGILTTLF